MRSKGDVGKMIVTGARGNNIAGAVDLGFPAQGTEFGDEPLSSLLLKESGGRNAAEAQMLFINPVALAPEPLKRRADAWKRGKFCDG